MLPGTPLAVGDGFNPALSFYPAMPASVEMTVTHYPYSDPAQVSTHTISGQANAYGYFQLAETPLSFSAPGEYRVDVVAQYTAVDGTLYMGTMSWGGIVMTPPGEATLVANGRRGNDALANIPNRGKHHVVHMEPHSQSFVGRGSNGNGAGAGAGRVADDQHDRDDNDSHGRGG